MPFADILSAAFSSWLMVLVTEIVVLPLTKLLADRVKHAEGIQHYDAPPPLAAAE